MSQSRVPVPVQSTAGTWECGCLAHWFGNAADNRLLEFRCPSDMTDAEWVVVRPVPGWMQGQGGPPETYCHRAVPADFPPWDRGNAFFRRWCDRGLVREFHDRGARAGPGSSPVLTTPAATSFTAFPHIHLSPDVARRRDRTAGASGSSSTCELGRAPSLSLTPTRFGHVAGGFPASTLCGAATVVTKAP